jgi:hypothetical protein
MVGGERLAVSGWRVAVAEMTGLRFPAVESFTLVAVALGSCAGFQVQARLPLAAPLDRSCMDSALSRIADHPVHAYQWVEGGRRRDSFLVNGRSVEQVTSVDSAQVFLAGSRPLERVGRIKPMKMDSVGAALATLMAQVRDSCGGRTPAGQPDYRVGSNMLPYEAWIVPGAGGRVALHWAPAAVRHVPILDWHFPAGRRYVLSVDTLAQGGVRWIRTHGQVIRLPKGHVLASHCARPDSAPAGSFVAVARATEDPFFGQMVEAWELDRSALQIRPATTDGVVCRNPDWSSPLPSAAPGRRAVALTFQPSPGTARIYAYGSGWSPRWKEGQLVVVDSQVVGSIAQSAVLMLEVAPGTHLVGPRRGRSVSLDVVADSVYFVRFRWRAFRGLTADVVPPAQGRPAVTTGQMVEQQPERRDSTFH